MRRGGKPGADTPGLTTKPIRGRGRCGEHWAALAVRASRPGGGERACRWRTWRLTPPGGALENGGDGVGNGGGQGPRGKAAPGRWRPGSRTGRGKADEEDGKEPRGGRERGVRQFLSGLGSPGRYQGGHDPVTPGGGYRPWRAATRSPDRGRSVPSHAGPHRRGWVGRSGREQRGRMFAGDSVPVRIILRVDPGGCARVSTRSPEAATDPPPPGRSATGRRPRSTRSPPPPRTVRRPPCHRRGRRRASPR